MGFWVLGGVRKVQLSDASNHESGLRYLQIPSFFFGVKMLGFDFDFQ